MKPGMNWRVSAGSRLTLKVEHGECTFDELVIDDWFHLEQMDTREWHLNVGKKHCSIMIDKHGNATMGPWYE